MAQYEGYLRGNMGNYRYGDAARRDIVTALHQYQDLRPCTESFTFPNGETKPLLALSGTIPVRHKGNTYNIPVCLYMQPNAPYDPPLVYVRPTSTMEIRVSQTADASGKIYLPFLNNWKHPQSDLSSLLQLLQIQFGETPPVVSRGNRPPQPQMQQHQPVAGNYGWSPSISQPSWPAQPQYPPQQQQQQQHPYGYQPPMLQYQQQQQQQPPYQQQGQGTRQDFNEEAMRLSVQSAAEDRLRRRYMDNRAQLQAELEVVRRTGQELSDGKVKIEGLLRNIEAEQAGLTNYISQLKQKNSEAEDLLKQMDTQEQISVDEAVNATAPLYRQIVRCYAEDQALEDTMFALGDALKRNAISIDDYLKNIRELSRRQFLARATLQAGRLKAGLPEV